jgi:radical SAM protein with 4Fe4S-binding SPASM domain
MSYKESRGIIRKITITKLWNILLLKISFNISLIFRKVFHWGNPMAISIEPTTSCNLRCPECLSGLRSFSRPTGMLDFDFYKRIIDQVSPSLSYLILYFQGEPYLNPDFFNLIEYASKKNIYTTTSTNAHYLDDIRAKQTILSGLDKIIISIDGTDQETYEKYRIGGSINKVIEGIQKLVYWKNKLNKSNPLIVLQYLIFKTNQHQIDQIKKLSEALNVDQLNLKTAQIYDFQDGSGLIPDNTNYSRYKKVNGKYVIKNKLLNKCWRMWSSSVITWDGKVVPCCFDKDATYRLGDLTEKDFSEIWKSQDQLTFREHIIRSRKDIDICKNCTEGSNIWAN